MVKMSYIKKIDNEPRYRDMGSDLYSKKVYYNVKEITEVVFSPLTHVKTLYVYGDFIGNYGNCSNEGFSYG